MNRLPLLILLGFCLLSALPPLVFGWQSAPLERGAFVAFGLWLLPLLRAGLPSTPSRQALLGGALCVTGILLDFNLLRLAGFAVSANSLLLQRKRTVQLTHLTAALLWMPLFGWLAHQLPFTAVFGLRVLGTVAANLPFWKGPRPT